RQWQRESDRLDAEVRRRRRSRLRALVALKSARLKGFMIHDLVIVGAGPVGATLALALRESDLDVVTLDARPAGTIARSDRSLALSHGARLIFERLDVWSAVNAVPGAVTPIAAIDISQRGGFGRARLNARDQGVDALGYVVSYRALQHALDEALVRAGMSVEHGVGVTRVSATA